MKRVLLSLLLILLTVIECRAQSAAASVRLELDGLPAGIDRISLIPTEGEITEIPVTVPESGSVILWLEKEQQHLPATVAAAMDADGRIWSVRLPALDLQADTVYRWSGTLLAPDAQDTDLKAYPLPQTLLDIEYGEYSGITRISGNRYAVVDDNLKGGGIIFFSIPMDSDGNIGTPGSVP